MTENVDIAEYIVFDLVLNLYLLTRLTRWLSSGNALFLVAFSVKTKMAFWSVSIVFVYMVKSGKMAG